MRLLADHLLLSPTDLSTFVNCRHKTGLDLAAAHKVIDRPRVVNPYTALLQQRGAEHEAAYVASLRAEGLRVVVVESGWDAKDAGTEVPALRTTVTSQSDATLAAMREGADVIVQGRLAHGDLAGYADILRRVERPSALGAWSYEAYDTKLARETKGATILQMCAYSALLEELQGTLPERFHVVTPDPVTPLHSYRVHDYLAYFRMVCRGLLAALAQGHETLRDAHYPEPVEHCAVCGWEGRCHARRRADDHLSFIAGAARTHRQELATQGHATLAAAAVMPVPVTFTPARGSRDTYDRLGHQARVQHQQRTGGMPVVERLPITAGEGLTRLPAPSPRDVFLDLEGARFAREGGREFLFGLWMPAEGAYRAWWATTDAEERAAFEAVMDVIAEGWTADPGMHVYHFNHYEPTAFKKLVGRYVTRGEPLDQLLRAERFVDLYPIVRQAVRCGVESYSIKQLEQYSGYTRRVNLKDAAQPLLAVEMALESQAPDAIAGDIRDAVQGYNEDDCRSTEALRDWLEGLRAEAVAEGAEVARPVSPTGEPTPAVTELQQRVETLRAELLALADAEQDDESRAVALRTLAYLIDWHRREENADWWEYFRLKEQPAEDLFDERDAIAGLTFVERLGPVIGKTGKPTKSVRDRYSYPRQEVEIGAKGKLHARDGKGFGSIAAHDRLARIIDIEKGPSRTDDHPSEVFACDVISSKGPQESVMRLASTLVRRAGTSDPAAEPTCGLALLFRHPPRLTTGTFAPLEGETATDFAVRIVTDLDATTLPIQGPPGAGKTFAGARMIRALVAAGRRVGVTATSHKVIRNLLDEVAAQAAAAGETVRLGAKVTEADETPAGIAQFDDNGEALAAITTEPAVDVLGGTAWLWSRPEFANTVDVLFVDEAGQMSLANVLAVSPAARSLALLGDPRQLDQPQKANHPDGVGVSALQHVLGDAETMPAERGIFLPVTYRMAPAITTFTSELFYAGQLTAAPGLHHQRLAAGRFAGAGLWMVPVAHDANRSASPEEVEAIAALVAELLGTERRDDELGAPNEGAASPTWTDASGTPRPLAAADLRIVAPFNAQVNRLKERLPWMAEWIGTVDKFQGQTAAVVIYSMTTSRPEDAPRGLEFLYSLNRLNVATSRARCAVFVVASPRLLEPECRTPRQMALANALCRYAEVAQVTPGVRV